LTSSQLLVYSTNFRCGVLVADFLIVDRAFLLKCATKREQKVERWKLTRGSDEFSALSNLLRTRQ